MRTTASFSLFWALLMFSNPTSAEPSSSLQPINGILSFGRGQDAAAQQVFEAAARNPNSTSFISFNRTDFNTVQEWAWRISITDVPLPNNFSELGMPSVNASENIHVINTLFELQWPGASQNQSLQLYLQSINSSLLITAVEISLPSSFISSYSNQTNGTCADILGNQCTQSLMKAASSMGAGFGTSGLDGCADSLDKGRGIGGIGYEVSPTSNSSTLLGDPLYYYSSSAFTGGNETLLNQAKSAVNILALRVQAAPRMVGTGSPGDASVLCQVVDKSAHTSGALSGWRLASSSAAWSLGITALGAVLQLL